MLTKKRADKRKKEPFTMHASLCGGGDLLQALASVAHYLADGIFYSTNDNFRRIFSRFDKLDRSYLGFLHFSCALIWWR